MPTKQHAVACAACAGAHTVRGSGFPVRRWHGHRQLPPGLHAQRRQFQRGSAVCARPDELHGLCWYAPTPRIVCPTPSRPRYQPSCSSLVPRPTPCTPHLRAVHAFAASLLRARGSVAPPRHMRASHVLTSGCPGLWCASTADTTFNATMTTRTVKPELFAMGDCTDAQPSLSRGCMSCAPVSVAPALVTRATPRLVFATA